MFKVVHPPRCQNADVMLSIRIRLPVLVKGFGVGCFGRAHLLLEALILKVVAAERACRTGSTNGSAASAGSGQP